MRDGRLMDLTAIVSGLAVTLFGTLLLLDRLSVLDLGFGGAIPAVLAVVGVTLLAAGLEGPRRR